MLSAFAYYIEINTSLIVVIFRSVHVSPSSCEVAYPPSAKKRHNGMKTVRVVLNPAYEGGGHVKMTLVRIKTLPFFFVKIFVAHIPRLSCHRNSDELPSLREYDIVGYEQNLVLKCREERAAGSATNDAPRVDGAVDDIVKSTWLTKSETFAFLKKY